jgi:hypothetical protein
MSALDNTLTLPARSATSGRRGVRASCSRCWRR